ncbi:phage tail protein [Flavobacterium artemisiae]|uniref:Phage tail protein n=1 Tax=Flavobacterium artemisiae TaxID=2126556 RepID=A0ABW4H7Z7_9FLAO
MNNSATPVAVGDFPIGTIVPFAGAINSDFLRTQGWFYCNGNTVSRTDYSELFSVIGTNFGAGDNSTTFNLPDFRGTFLRGVNGASNNDPDAISRTAPAKGGSTGNNVGSSQGFATGNPQTPLITNQTGEHTHTVPHVPNDNSSYAVAGSYQAIWNSNGASTDAAGSHTHNVTGGGDKESRPINVNTYFIIKGMNV